MKQIRLILLTILLSIICSTSTLAAEFSNAYELYEHWYTTRTDLNGSPYPPYVCGVWTTDNGATLTIALTKDEAGEAGKAEILERIENDNTAQFTWQTYSHAELFAIQCELTEFLGNQTGANSIGVDEMENVVSIGIDMENPGSEDFVQKCLETYGSRVRFEDTRGLIISCAVAEEALPVQPAGIASGNVPGRYPSGMLWALTALFALFCLTLWRLHLHRGVTQRADGGTESSPLTLKETEAAAREQLVSPPSHLRQAILEAVQKDML